MAVAVSQLSPSGDVRVCPDAVVEVTCNISRSRQLLSWVVTPPGEAAIPNFLRTTSLPEIGQPVPFELPGINITIDNVTSTSIISSLTVDTSQYEITSDPITVTCTGADGQADIRNLG